MDGTTADSSARQVSSTPNMAALAAATVAAATAWWAAHGLLPLCAPLPTGFTSTPPSSSVEPITGAGQAATTQNDMREKACQDHLDQDNPDTVQAVNSASKCLPLSLTGSEESGREKLENDSKVTECTEIAGKIDSPDLNKTEAGKPVDRSSCGSNTTSSSEVETDALEKQEKSNEMPTLVVSDSSNSKADGNRRRTNSSSSDSWKEVSEEGRLAFRALFSRHVLPQSFSPPRNAKQIGLEVDNVKDKEQTAGGEGDAPTIDLNSKIQTCHARQDSEEKPHSHGHEGLLLTIGPGNEKLRTRRTGFKPYKRCSVEAKEMRVANVGGQGEEKCPKRIRLEGDSST